MIYPVRSSDVLLEINPGTLPKTEEVLSGESAIALNLIKNCGHFAYVFAGDNLPKFEMHKMAGGIERYYIIGHTSCQVLERVVNELKNLEFEVIIIVDLLKISELENIYKYFKTIKDRFGVRRCFSEDFVPITLEHNRWRGEKRR
jgi:hypothetical protein